MSYAAREIDASDPASEGESVLDHFMRIFKITAELIEDAAQEQGIDLSGVDSENWRRQDVEHLLSRLSLVYFRNIEIWIERNQPMLAKHLGHEGERPSLHLVTDEQYASTQLARPLEIVSRLASLIHIKIVRALWRPNVIGDAQVDTYDAYGSAKCALVAMDESIEAWIAIVHALVPNQGCSEFVATLERMRLILEQTMPEARNFVRPGFDEPSCFC